MACISKLAASLSYDCDTGATGLISALIINKADIASFVVTGSVVSGITLSAGASAYKVDTVKRALVLTEALKVNDGAPNAFSHGATCTVTRWEVNGLASGLENLIVNPFTNGSFVILARGPRGVVRAYGLYYGMSATSLDRSSHDNGGWATVTMSTPENVIGEDALAVSGTLYDTLYAAAV